MTHVVAAEDRHRLTAPTGFAALGLDALASCAYGPESIVLLLIGEVAPNHWWEQALFNRRGAVVARYASRHTTAVVCRLRFRLLPRTSNIAPASARRPRGLVLPRR